MSQPDFSLRENVKDGCNYLTKALRSDKKQVLCKYISNKQPTHLTPHILLDWGRVCCRVGGSIASADTTHGSCLYTVVRAASLVDPDRQTDRGKVE